MSQVEIAAKYQSTENADDSVPSLSVMEQYALNLRDLNGLRYLLFVGCLYKSFLPRCPICLLRK